MLIARAPSCSQRSTAKNYNFSRSSNIHQFNQQNLQLPTKRLYTNELHRDGKKDEFLKPVEDQIKSTYKVFDEETQVKTPQDKAAEDVKKALAHPPSKVASAIKPAFMTTIRALDKVFMLARPFLKVVRKGVDLVANGAEKGELKAKQGFAQLAEKYPWLGYMFHLDVQNRVQDHVQFRPLPTKYDNPVNDPDEKAYRLAKDYYYQRVQYLDKEAKYPTDKPVIVKHLGKVITFDDRNLNNPIPDEHLAPLMTWVYLDKQTGKPVYPLRVESMQPYESNAEYIERTIELDENDLKSMKQKQEEEAQLVYESVQHSIQNMIKQKQEEEAAEALRQIEEVQELEELELKMEEEERLEKEEESKLFAAQQLQQPAPRV